MKVGVQAMNNRAIAGLAAASLALGSAGCHPHANCNPGAERDLFGVVLVHALGFCNSSGGTATPRAWTDEERAAADKAHAAAEHGDAGAQFELGAMYEAGRGVSRDDAEAAKWYRKSADQGFGRAQLALAFIYGTGRGIGHDDIQAYMWCTLAASSRGFTRL